MSGRISQLSHQWLTGGRIAKGCRAKQSLERGQVEIAAVCRAPHLRLGGRQHTTLPKEPQRTGFQRAQVADASFATISPNGGALCASQTVSTRDKRFSPRASGEAKH